MILNSAVAQLFALRRAFIFSGESTPSRRSPSLIFSSADTGLGLPFLRNVWRCASLVHRSRHNGNWIHASFRRHIAYLLNEYIRFFFFALYPLFFAARRHRFVFGPG
jgi:hypothetical protein